MIDGLKKLITVPVHFYIADKIDLANEVHVMLSCEHWCLLLQFHL